MRPALALLLAALLASPGAAEIVADSGSPPAPAEADLAQCFAWAVEQAESLKIQQEQIYQLEQQFKQVLAAALPNLSFNAQEKRLDQSGASGGPSFLFESPQPQVNFALSQPLFSGLREYAAMRSYKKQGQAAELQLRRARALLYGNVASAFYLTVNLESQLDDEKLAVSLSTARIKELRRFEDLGKSRRSEVTLVESQEAAQESQVETIRGQVDAARALLSFLAGKDLSATKLNDRLEPVRDLEPEELVLGRALERADVRALRKLVESQEAQVALAKGAWAPTISATGDYYLKRQSALEPIHWDAAILGSVPLFAGGGQLAAVRQAKSQLSQAEDSFELGLRQARSDIHTAYVALRSVVASAVAAERAYVKADETYKLEEKEYRLGLVNNLDVLTAMNNLVSAKTTFDQILIQSKLDLLQLKAADEELPEK